MRSKSLFKSKVFYGAISTIIIGVLAYQGGNKAEGLTGIVSGIGIIAARLNSNTKTHIIKPKTGL